MPCRCQKRPARQTLSPEEGRRAGPLCGRAVLAPDASLWGPPGTWADLPELDGKRGPTEPELMKMELEVFSLSLFHSTTKSRRAASTSRARAPHSTAAAAQPSNVKVRDWTSRAAPSTLAQRALSIQAH
ncbi:predicted protein [Chaetomium globosum CBS 148.51]|uniref:Uncharacterized protein n=1 Tax=Chaetomium globosum (strain ATCC 6205 / CBS 148.51 / DSM 1962 / NBRC 6347 / NRRL 1970) TaxID=306901 RepID=Q2HA63_CHAGB|nr:uncharacterized protein CHGG_02891 [Chaetomium globosum CBS 148.51]EAQ90956.1 predicted protein [Chaetomium globosum CBS 148.51]